MVGPTRNNIHARVGSITWIPHHRSNSQAGSIFYRRQQVKSASAEQYPYRKFSTRSSDATIHVGCPSPPMFRTRASQNLASLKNWNNVPVWRICIPLSKTPFKRPGSEYFSRPKCIFLHVLKLHFRLGSRVFLGQKLDRFQPYYFLFWMFRKNCI